MAIKTGLPLLILGFALVASAAEPTCEPQWIGKPLAVHAVAPGKRLLLCGRGTSQKGTYHLNGFSIVAEGFQKSDSREVMAQASENEYATARSSEDGFVIGRWEQMPENPGDRSVKYGPVLIYECGVACTPTECHKTPKRCLYKGTKSLYPKAISELKKLEKIKTEGFDKPVLPDNGIPFRLAFDAIASDKNALSELRSIPSRFALDGAASEDYDQAMDLVHSATEAGCIR